MTDIVFGHSYFMRFDPKLWAAHQPYPPLGTLYAAAIAREAGYDVALFDAMLAETEDEWAAALDRDRPRYAVLFEDNFNYLSKMCLLRMRAAAQTMIAMAKERGCTVLVCGADATDHADLYLDAGTDFVLLGEGEVTLVKLLRHLDASTSGEPTAILGLAWRRGTMTFRTTPRPVLADLDALPSPAWDLLDIDNYRSVWRSHHGYFSMNLVTTRGCPYHCNWCAKPIWGQRYHSHSPERVAGEMARLKSDFGVEHIWFADDIMGLKPGWWRGFAAAVAAQDASLPFKCLSRADLILRHAEDLPALRKAGCDIVWIGAESGSQKVLNAMDKGTTTEQIAQATRLLHAAGIRVGFFLQFGYPGETWDDIEATLQLVRDCAPDDIGMSVSYPLPGTRFYESVRQQLREKQNWHDSADLEMLYEGPQSTAFYRQLHRVLHTEYRARRAVCELRGTALGSPFATPHGRVRQLRPLLRGLALPVERARLSRLRQPERAPILPPTPLGQAPAATPTAQPD